MGGACSSVLDGDYDQVRYPSVIRFYDVHQPFYSFTNFAHTGIFYEDSLYPSAEHLFQAHKFFYTRPDVAEEVRKCATSRDAYDLAKKYKHYARGDWKQVNIHIMTKVLILKFTQHPELTKELMSTGDARLIEASPRDNFWGEGHDGRGRNELGKALMWTRDMLREIMVFDDFEGGRIRKTQFEEFGDGRRRSQFPAIEGPRRRSAVSRI